jgi:hypothetical protein
MQRNLLALGRMASFYFSFFQSAFSFLQPFPRRASNVLRVAADDHEARQRLVLVR